MGLFGCLADLTQHFNNINFQEPLRERPYDKPEIRKNDGSDGLR
jgi:hypothetical protein